MHLWVKVGGARQRDKLCGSDGVTEIQQGSVGSSQGGNSNRRRKSPQVTEGARPGQGWRWHIPLHPPGPCPRMLSRDGGDGGWGGESGHGRPSRVQPRPPAGCDGGQAGPMGGSFPAPQDRQTERAGAGLVMVLRAAGWAGGGQHVAWPPLGPHVPGGGHGGCPPPGCSAGDNVGCPEPVGRHPYSHGDSPQPTLGVGNMAEHSSSKFPPEQPQEWQFAHSGGPQGRRCWGVPRPP